MKESLKLLLAILITSNTVPHSLGQFGMFGPMNQGSKNGMQNFMGIPFSGGMSNNHISTSSPWDNIFRNKAFDTNSKNGLLGNTGSSVNPAYPMQVSQQPNFDARLSQLETEFRQKIEEIKLETRRNSKTQDEKIEEIKTQLNRNSKAQDEKIDEIKTQNSRSIQTQDEKIEEIKSQLSKSIKVQDGKIEEIKTQTGRNSKDQDEKIAIIRVRERNLAQHLNQSREEMLVLKTQNQDQSKKIEELERKITIQSTQPAPEALMKPDNNKEFTGMPTNCNELNQIGHSLNGFYLVRGQGSDKCQNKIDTIFCNFKKNDASSPVQETRVGYVNVKHSEGVLFILTRRPIFQIHNSYKEVPILFVNEEINIGGGMNLSTSVFTAPRTGLYEFRYSEVLSVSKTGSLQSPSIYLKVNAHTKSLVPIQTSSQAAPQFGNEGFLVNLESLQMLKVGDQVELSVNPGGSSFYFSLRSKWASYSGRLVEEDLIF